MKEACLKNGKSKIWKFVHHCDRRVDSSRLKGKSFESNWLIISPVGYLIVKGSFQRGFAWDGCSPKARISQFLLGTPDGALTKFGSRDYKPYTYYASMVHDAIYQHKKCVPLSRKECDLLFKDMLNEANFKFYWIYYAVVRLGGWLYGKWNKL